MKRKNIIGILAILMLFSGFLVGCSSQDELEIRESVSILFVGNSHIRTGNVPRQLQEIAKLNGIEMTYVDVSINGQNLDSVMRGNAIREMQNTNFDYVVFAALGPSLRPASNIDAFLYDVRFFSQLVRENGATPVLYGFGWGHANSHIDEKLQDTLSQAHRRAAYENDLILINAGDAWVYAYRAIDGLSLFSRDGNHANHAGAFLNASVLAATLFDLHIENIPTGNIIDTTPLLAIITILSIAVVIGLFTYHLVKKKPLPIIKSLVVIMPIILLQAMSFFPHVFLFTEVGNRVLLLCLLVFYLSTMLIYSIYSLLRTKEYKKYILHTLICFVIYGATFIPALDIRSPIYRGNHAPALTQAALNFSEATRESVASSDAITLTIVERQWSEWHAEQPPITTIQEVAGGNTIILESWENEGFVVEIKEVQDDFVVISYAYFHDEAYQHMRVSSIRYGDEYKITTPTDSSWFDWTLVFER